MGNSIVFLAQSCLIHVQEHLLNRLILKIAELQAMQRIVSEQHQPVFRLQSRYIVDTIVLLNTSDNCFL